MSGYAELKVWQLNQDCIREALRIIENLPDKFAFTHIGKQLFRALTSVGANIAEGQDSYEGKEFARYLNISIRSAIEADHWVKTLRNLSCDYNLSLLENSNVESIKMLKGLKRSIELKREN